MSNLDTYNVMADIAQGMGKALDDFNKALVYAGEQMTACGSATLAAWQYMIEDNLAWLRQLSPQQLRALGQQRRVENWHSLSRDFLISELSFYEDIQEPVRV